MALHRRLPEAWQRNIAARNAAVLAGETQDYYVDEGLLEKIQAAFEPPAREEMDFWYQGSAGPALPPSYKTQRGLPQPGGLLYFILFYSHSMVAGGLGDMS